MTISVSNVIAAIIILILGITLGNLAGRFTKRAIITLELKKYFKFQIDSIASRVIAWLIYIFTIIIALINLGIATPILYAIIIILLALIAGAVFLSLKDFIPNVIAGATLQKRELKKGMNIKFNDISGKIEEFTITETKIKSGNDIIFVPNSLLVKEILHLREKSRK
ncbi:MAG: mechanosensitive ion channel [Nanoarchaeota archaeon]|nr:mechanosensitive ion channel [Nanoarchaeota archaeon]